jgi:hypothetical protein
MECLLFFFYFDITRSGVTVTMSTNAVGKRADGMSSVFHAISKAKRLK